MPELVSKKIRKIIQNRALLKGKSKQIHCNINSVFIFAGAMLERERYQETIENYAKIHPKIIGKRDMQQKASKRENMEGKGSPHDLQNKFKIEKQPFVH